MSIQSAYNDWSQTYDSDPNATRDLDQTVLERTFGLSHFDCIIEAGCGTGKNTELLARVGGKVHALDFSDGMLAQAQTKLRHRPNVTFAVADLTQRWPCADRSANLVTCNLVLEHIRDLAPVFAEAARVLASGGIFFVSELHPFRQYDGKVAVYQRGDKTTEIPAFIHHISDFLKAAETNGFTLKTLQEWWHEKDAGKLPRLVSFLFESNPAKL
jgi:ubiquinone/menaquinone biosynthesis C-methylase UbiE